MKKWNILLLITAFILTGCKSSKIEQISVTQTPLTEPTVIEGEYPFKNLDKDEIEEVSLLTSSPGKGLPLTKKRIDQLVELLNKIVIYNQASPETLNGRMVQYTITKLDGSTLTIKEINPYFIIDNVWYNTKYEPCEELSQFADTILDEFGYTY